MEIKKIEEKLKTPEGRTELRNMINDLAYLGPVNEAKRNLEKKLGDDALEYINIFATTEGKAAEMMSIIHCALRRIDELESN